MTTKTKGWAVVVGGKTVATADTREEGRQKGRARGDRFKVVKASEAPASAQRRHRKQTGGGYVPAVRRRCHECGHYRKRETLRDDEREVTFDRGGKQVTQTRTVLVCKGGCRENER